MVSKLWNLKMAMVWFLGPINWSWSRTYPNFILDKNGGIANRLMCSFIQTFSVECIKPKKKTNSSTRITFNVQYMKYEQKLMNLWNTAKKKKPKKSSKCFIKCSK